MRCCRLLFGFASTLVSTVGAQQPAALPMGTVPTRDAKVTGGLEVQGESARLLTNASVTAFDHTASIALARGGEVLVCSTSQFHLLRSGAAGSLLFGLDRGAVEVHSASQPQDVLLTPDIQFAVQAPGQFDLKVRVTPNGDTCVDNTGTAAPVLLLSDVFSSTSYRLLPGQHVLFEHGSLREVVDRERSSCGCPTPTPPPQVVASARASTGEPTTPSVAAVQHPFPEAESNGLAPAVPVANSPEGVKGTQVATTLSYGEGQGPPPSTLPVPASPTATAASSAQRSATSAGGTSSATTGSAADTSPEPPPAPPGAHDLAHAFGRFFHKLFHPKS